MSQSVVVHATLEDWISREAIGFSAESSERFNAAIDQLMAILGDSVELLGLGEALHGDEEILKLRNRLVQRLVEKHGYSAIAIESSFPRGRIVNDYVAGRGAATYDEVKESGFSHHFGRSDANRQLVEWMRAYNADPSHRIKLRFYGFDSPTEMMSTDSPRQLLTLALDYLDSMENAPGEVRRLRIDSLLGVDADWENPAAMFDPAKSVGLSPAATSLRLETEELISELHLRRPELAPKNQERHAEATQHALLARQLLNYHASLARPSNNRTAELLGIRDLMMADNLAYMVRQERNRGKVLAFAHNTHLQRGRAKWQLGPDALEWWPAGAHLHELLEARYAVIGTGMGISKAQGIEAPETKTLEAHLAIRGEPALFIPTHRSQGLPTEEIAALPKRSSSAKNSTYFPLTAQSLTDFDALLLQE